MHDLRRTGANMLSRPGVMNEIRPLLRHTRLATTADICVAVLEDVRRGTAGMDDVLTRLRHPADATDSDQQEGVV
ncbi:hypothetical protein [Frankia sp. ACN1ag]|uniref:hypothetical protein n=1 Tax=Frankia sp. ACN1ag TaxID=102891 RepID=UPI0007076141|nr:hypothetical protein [Frankia sp. ACN1ag]KQC34852.1 hypothetical protein UK82_29740 [Frankia sp. ACN1ag]